MSAEEVRDMADDEMSDAAEARVEPVGSGGKVLVWECSVGDFNGRSEEAVAEHIAATHGDKAPSKTRTRK